MRNEILPFLWTLCLLPACTGGLVAETSSGAGAGGAKTTGEGASSSTGDTTTSETSASTDPLCMPSGSSGTIPWGRALDDHVFPGAIVVDPTGSPVLAGTMQGQVDIGGVVLGTIENGSDAFVAKLDPCGEVLWAKGFGAIEKLDWFVALDVDEQGRIALVTTDTVADLSTSTIRVLDAAGGELWTMDVHHFLWAGGGVSVTADGGLILAGSVASEEPDLGGGAIPGLQGKHVIARLDAAGALMWTASVEWVGYPAMAVSSQGDVYFTQTKTYEENRLSVTKIDAGGSVLWTYEAPGTGSLWAPATAVADEEGVFVVASYTDMLDLGVGNPASPGGMAGFLLRLSAAGQPIWADVVLPAGPSSNVWLVASPLTGDGGVEMVGSYVGTVDVAGTGALPSSASQNAFFARASKDGAIVWTSTTKGMLDQANRQSAAVGPDGRMWAVVGIEGTLDLADGTQLTPLPYGVGEALVWVEP